jgi:hypothetical protein
MAATSQQGALYLPPFWLRQVDGSNGIQGGNESPTRIPGPTIGEGAPPPPPPAARCTPPLC